jgi:hypothetical protein
MGPRFPFTLRIVVRLCAGMISFLLFLGSYVTSSYGVLPPPVQYKQIHKLTSPGGGWQFGWSIALDDDLLVVGAAAGVDAYVFNARTGQTIQTLHSTTVGPNDLYGFSVGLDDGIAIVGEGQDDQAYLFDAVSGQLLHVLTPYDGGDGVRRSFGRHVAIGGGYAIVGAAYDKTHGTQSGAAYVIDVSSGQTVHKWTGDRAYDGFGDAVAMSDDVAVVCNQYMIGRGKTFVYDPDTGQRLRQLAPVGGMPYSSFIMATAIDEDRIVVGASCIGSTGTALSFDATTGQELGRVSAPLDNCSGFPSAVDVSGHLAILGAWDYFVDGLGNSVGTAYLFDTETGDLLAEIQRDELVAQADYGFSVAIDGDLIAIGANGETGVDGAVYIFQRVVPEPSILALAVVAACVCVVMRGRNFRRR